MDALWRKSLERIQGRFQAASEQGKTVTVCLIHVANPNDGPFSSGPPSLKHERPVAYQAGAISLEPLVAVNSSGEPAGIRSGFRRLHHYYAQESVGSSEYRKLAGEAGDCYGGFPSEIKRHLWADVPQDAMLSTDKPCDLWTDALFELAWREIPGTPLRASDKSAWHNNTSVSLAILEHRERFPFSIPPEIKQPPDHWYSIIEDVFSASVAAIDVILSMPWETPGATPRPPGWCFNSGPPTALPELIVWLTKRAGWIRENNANRFSREFADEIIREVDGPDVVSDPQSHIWIYTRNLFANVRFWCEQRGLFGYPMWHADDSDTLAFLKADEYLSELLSFLRSSLPAGSKAHNATNAQTPSCDEMLPDDPITLLEMARLGVVDIGTVRNWGAAVRPEPKVRQRGRRAAIYSYRELREWFLKKQPDKGAYWPDEYKKARATLAKMSN